MDKLAQKIFDELDRFEKFSTYITKEDAARIAAKICLEIAENAYKAGGNGEYYDEGLGGMNDEFSKEGFEDFKREIL
jgi:hypothetical protein